MVVSVKQFNVFGCHKIVSETTRLPFEYNRKSNVFVDVNVGVKNQNFKFPLILDK